MDPTHIFLAVLSVVVGAMVIVGFIAMARILKKDEAIDAATFLALRQLDEYIKSTRSSGR